MPSGLSCSVSRSATCCGWRCCRNGRRVVGGPPGRESIAFLFQGQAVEHRTNQRREQRGSTFFYGELSTKNKRQSSQKQSASRVCLKGQPANLAIALCA